jgi:hypothetical protein
MVWDASQYFSFFSMELGARSALPTRTGFSFSMRMLSMVWNASQYFSFCSMELGARMPTRTFFFDEDALDGLGCQPILFFLFVLFDLSSSVI